MQGNSAPSLWASRKVDPLAYVEISLPQIPIKNGWLDLNLFTSDIEVQYAYLNEIAEQRIEDDIMEADAEAKKGYEFWYQNWQTNRRAQAQGMQFYVVEAPKYQYEITNSSKYDDEEVERHDEEDFKEYQRYQ